MESKLRQLINSKVLGSTFTQQAASYADADGHQTLGERMKNMGKSAFISTLVNNHGVMGRVMEDKLNGQNTSFKETFKDHMKHAMLNTAESNVGAAVAAAMVSSGSSFAPATPVTTDIVARIDKKINDIATVLDQRIDETTKKLELKVERHAIQVNKDYEFIRTQQRRMEAELQELRRMARGQSDDAMKVLNKQRDNPILNALNKRTDRSVKNRIALALTGQTQGGSSALSNITGMMAAPIIGKAVGIAGLGIGVGVGIGAAGWGLGTGLAEIGKGIGDWIGGGKKGDLDKIDETKPIDISILEDITFKTNKFITLKAKKIVLDAEQIVIARQGSLKLDGFGGTAQRPLPLQSPSGQPLRPDPNMETSNDFELNNPRFGMGEGLKNLPRFGQGGQGGSPSGVPSTSVPSQTPSAPARQPGSSSTANEPSSSTPSTPSPPVSVPIDDNRFKFGEGLKSLPRFQSNAPPEDPSHSSRSVPGNASGMPGKESGIPGGIDRSSFRDQLNNPEVRDRLYALTLAEVGTKNTEAQTALMETIFNRASFRKTDLWKQMQANYYEPLQTGAYQKNGVNKLTPEARAQLDKVLERVMSGSNVSDFALHNSSARVADNAKRNHAWHKDIGGETFSTKGGAPGDPDERKVRDVLPRIRQDQPAQNSTPDGSGRFVFDANRMYSRRDIDSQIREHGKGVLIGLNPAIPGHDETARYVKEQGGRLHNYFLGPGEPAKGYDGKGAVFGSDQSEINSHIKKMGITREQWDNGGWWDWHQKQLLDAKEKGILPDTVEFDNMNTLGAKNSAEYMAKFSEFRSKHGLSTQMIPKNLDKDQTAEIDRLIKEGRIDPKMFANRQILEEYASKEQAAHVDQWGKQMGMTLDRTTDTKYYSSPNRGREAFGQSRQQEVAPSQDRFGSMQNVPMRNVETRKGEAGEFNYSLSPDGVREFGEPGNVPLSQLKTMSGKTYSVNARVADSIGAFVSDLETRGYKINNIGGYANRPKAWGGGLSTHATGTTIDLNVQQNGLIDRNKTDMPENIEKLAWLYGMSWGGRFRDAMHFEKMSPQARANKLEQLVKEGFITKEVAKHVMEHGRPPPNYAGGNPASSNPMVNNNDSGYEDNYGSSAISSFQQALKANKNPMLELQDAINSQPNPIVDLKPPAPMPVSAPSSSDPAAGPSPSQTEAMPQKGEVDSSIIERPEHNPEEEAAKPSSAGYGSGKEIE